MEFAIDIAGYGFGFQINKYDFMMDCFIILSWTIVRKHLVWRGERHILYDGAYNYRCIKNGKDVENISLRSPIVNNI